MIRLEFGRKGGLASSQNETVPTREQVIIAIETQRVTSEKPTIVDDNFSTGKRQGAHVTSHRALRSFIESWLKGQTFLDAWQRIDKMWEFTNSLAVSWSGRDSLMSDAAKLVGLRLLPELEGGRGATKEWISRNDVPLRFSR
jgi:hypothetical protein